VRTSVVLPAREEAATVGAIVAACVPLADEVLVVDAASADGTAEMAARAGAEVVQEAELMPEFGAVAGKGDAMWRALSVVRGDVVLYLDADAREVDERFVRGMLDPLRDGAQFVKAHYRRPFMDAPEGGGRVTELTARPLLRAFYPELADIRQPLAGETAARRELLERLPYTTGYGVEIALLIDAWKEVGIDAIAQVDLGVRDNRHQPLSALGTMADEVLAAVTVRLEREGRLRPGERPVELVERPPMASVRVAG
jgi:glucosyl-3-phosphoglycerate synthase